MTEETEEIWKVINDFPGYQISNKGNVWTNKRKKIIKVFNGDVKLYDENKSSFTKSIEKLLREHFQEVNKDEIWKDIENFPDYQISNLGNVWSKLNSQYLKTTNQVGLYNGEIFKSYNVNTLIRQHFKISFNEDEIHKKIPGWNRYSISKNGRIRDEKRCIFLEPYLSTKGYLSVTLMGKKEKGNFYHLSHLLGLAFIPNPDNLPEVHHKDCNKLNNDLSNLEWVTTIENTQSKNKTIPIGNVYEKGDSWVACVTVYSKRYYFQCIKKELCEEWLEKRRYEIINNIPPETTGFIFPCRKSYKARVRINDEVKSFLNKSEKVCEEWLENIIKNNEIQQTRITS
tara:strand:+ start:98 stop:1123 length:1026 start_codon:yes stop_codon:yes gene_type:complete